MIEILFFFLISAYIGEAWLAAAQVPISIGQGCMKRVKEEWLGGCANRTECKPIKSIVLTSFLVGIFAFLIG